MSRYVTIHYSRRTPQARTQHVLNVAPTPAPTPTVYYLISGTTTDERVTGDGFSVPITFTGLGTFFTESTGSYGILVASGYSGVAIPILSGGSFVPSFRTYTSVGTDIPNQDYAFYGTGADVIIMGEVRIDGTAASGVVVDFTNDGQVTTDAFGTYIGTQSYGYSGSVTPIAFTFPTYDAVPPARVYTNLTESVAGQDFDIETLLFTISGAITSDVLSVAGLSLEFESVGTAVTNGSGFYSQVVPTGYSGTVTPHSASGTFDPLVRVYTNVLADTPNQDYVLYGTIPEVTLSGSVFSALFGGTGFAANLFVDTIGTISSNGSGFWSQVVTAPYTGAVYPVDVSGGTYNPAFRSYVSVAVNQTNQDFAFWAETPVWTLGGTLSNPTFTLPMGSVTIEVNGGTIYTDANGVYSFQIYNGSAYTIIPHESWSYDDDFDAIGSFTPASYSGVASGNNTGLNFTWNPTIYLISGTVTSDGTGITAGIEFSDDGTITTAASGSYGRNVLAGYSGTAIPHYASAGTFDPQFRVYTNLAADAPNQDYVFYAEAGSLITLSGSVFDSTTGTGITAFLWVDTVGTISTV